MKKLSINVVLVCTLILTNLSFVLAGGPNTWQGQGRIAVSSDGNFHDEDDWAASAATLMILANAELWDNLVLYTHSDHVWQSNAEGLEQMRTSVIGGADRFEFTGSQFPSETRLVEAAANAEVAYNAMRDAINASTADNPLFIIAGGPMQVVGEGLNRANASARNHVTVISHSTWNDDHSDKPHRDDTKPWTYDDVVHSGWTWGEMVSSFGSQVNFNHIPDQNVYTSINDGFASSQASSSGDKYWDCWYWMRDHSDPDVQWVYQRAVTMGRPDWSDAGMAYYLVTGDNQPGPFDLRDWIGNGVPDRTDVPCGDLTDINVAALPDLDEGECTFLSVTKVPTCATTGYNYSSSNTNIATVNTSGQVCGVAEGTATITVTSTVGNFTASTTVTVIKTDELSRAGMQVIYASSANSTTPKENILDGNTSTIWHSQWSPSIEGHPHEIHVDMGETKTLTDIGYLARQSGGLNGIVATYDVYVSNDNTNWGAVDASGTFNWSSGYLEVNKISFSSAVSGRYVNFVSKSAANGLDYTSMAEMYFYGSNGGSSDIDVTGVSIAPTSLSLVAGNTGALTATVSPSNATNQAVSWSSNNTSVATVNSSGVVTAGSAGSATITITTADGGFTATSAITVTSGNVSVNGVSVSPTSATLTSAGATQALNATVSPSNATNQTVSWSSNNTSVATVNSGGVVTAVANGSATITVTTNDGGFTASSAITVNIATSGQTPYGGSARVIPGTIEAEEYDNGGEGVAYHDNDANNAGANVMREDEGVDIEARDGGISVGWTAAGEWMEYTVNATAGTYEMQARVAAVAVGKTITVKLDGVTLGVIDVPNTGNWGTFQTVSIPNVSVTGGNGKILRIELTTGNVNLNWIEFISTSTNVPVTGVSVTPTSLSIAAGATGNLTATVSPSNATNQAVNWSSSNTAVATVNASGVVSGVAAGTATVTVTANDGGYTASSAVTVTGGGTTEPTTVILDPIHDAYLQNSARYNNTLLRIESGRRVGYLMYDLSGINGTITTASLTLTCTDDAGNGNININLGDGTGWTESNLSTSNAPSVGTLLGNLNSSYSIGSAYTATLSATSISGGGNVSIVLTQTDGNDVAFASKENSATAPQLTITYDELKSAEESIATKSHIPIKVYPNPVTGYVINVTGLSEDVNMQIINLQGQVVHTEQLIGSKSHKISLPSHLKQGVYILNFVSNTYTETQRILIK